MTCPQSYIFRTKKDLSVCLHVYQEDGFQDLFSYPLREHLGVILEALGRSLGSLGYSFGVLLGLTWLQLGPLGALLGSPGSSPKPF